MELLYVWIGKYKNIEKQGFNFSPKYRFSFDEETKTLSLDEDRSDKVIDNFFGERISNITAIVGENGSGKTSIIQFLISENTLHDTGISLMVFKYEDNDFVYIANGFENIKCPRDFINWQKYYENGNNYKIPIHIIYFSNVFEIYQNIVDVYNNRFYFSNLSLSYQLFEYTENIEKSKMKVDREEKGNFRAFTNLTLFKYKQYKIFNDFLAYIQAFDIEALSETLNFKGIQNCKIIFKYDFNSFYQRFNGPGLNAPLLNFDKYRKTIFSLFVLFNIQKQFANDNENSTKLSNFIIRCLSEKYNFNDFLTELKREFTPIYNFLNSCDKRGFYDNVTWDEIDIIELSFKIHWEDFDVFTEIQTELLRELEIDDFVAEIDWGLSSGEHALLNLFSLLYPEKKEILRESINDDNEIRSHIFLLDEADLYLHPNWAKKFIYYLVNVLPEIFDKPVQIILTTHSPFVLSDLPKENVIFLKSKDGKCEVQNGLTDIKQTFGANIHTLLSDGFFMDGLAGKFSSDKINEVIKYLNNETSTITEDETAEKIINIIGEPIIKRYLTQQLSLKKQNITFDKVKELENRIAELEKNQKDDKN